MAYPVLACITASFATVATMAAWLGPPPPFDQLVRLNKMVSAALEVESDDQLLALFDDKISVNRNGMPVQNTAVADADRSLKQKLVLMIKGGCPTKPINGFYSGNSLVMMFQKRVRLSESRRGLPDFDQQGKRIPRLNPGEANECTNFGPRTLVILSMSAPGKPITDSVQHVELWQSDYD
ncbi:hypothetical protein [Sphingomonas bacterium]|uniref:hypothetical protein n=1 Tax=Sphingomonas bacterium TaxID=1895847 RepID=UPI0015774C8B|nr:hypothetical protein [Sphingomonas bacterium]